MIEVGSLIPMEKNSFKKKKVNPEFLPSPYHDEGQSSQMNLSPTKYFGQIKYERSLGNYHISVSHHHVGEYIPKHKHKNPYFSLNIGAPYLENNFVSKQIIKPGNIILRPAGYVHQNTFSDKIGLCFNIEVTSSSRREVLDLFRNKNVSIPYLEFLQILTKSLSNYLDHELDCLITETLLIDQQSKNLIRAPSWYKQVVSKVREDYSDSLTLSDLAESVGLHPNYLARKFKKISGITLGDYIRRVRLEKASLKLYTQTRLTDIALDSGFYDQSHFSNTFRSTFNISPFALRYLMLH